MHKNTKKHKNVYTFFSVSDFRLAKKQSIQLYKNTTRIQTKYQKSTRNTRNIQRNIQETEKTTKN